jgi:hypothetical protein
VRAIEENFLFELDRSGVSWLSDSRPGPRYDGGDRGWFSDFSTLDVLLGVAGPSAGAVLLL